MKFKILFIFIISVFYYKFGFSIQNSSNNILASNQTNEDTTQIKQEIALSYALLENSEADSVINLAQNTHLLSVKKQYLYGIAHSQLVTAKAYNLKKNFPKALFYYLRSLNEFEKSNSRTIISDINYEIGVMYNNWEVHDKALEHLRVANMKSDKNDELKQISIFQAIAYTFVHLNNSDSAIFYYDIVYNYYKENERTEQIISTLRTIADINKNSGKYEASIKNQEQILDYFKKRKDISGEFSCLNNLGFLYKYLNNHDKSLEYFKEALNLYENKNINPSVYLNIGVIYQYKGDYETSLEYIFKALKIRQAERNLIETAKINNLLATTYFYLQDFETAINYAKMAIDIGEKTNNPDILHESYLIISKIHQSGGNFELALEYYQKYAAIKDSLKQDNQLKETELLSKKYFIDKTEKELKLYMAEEEVKDLTLKQLMLEKEQQEKELILLEENRILQKKQFELEKATTLQRLELVNQKLIAEKKDRQITELNKDRKIKEYELKQREIERKEREKELELLASNNKLLESDKQIKELEISREKVYRNIFIGAFLIISLISGLILFYYVKKRKANYTLSLQKKEIEEKNQELLSKNEEIHAQSEELKATNDKLVELDQFKEGMTGMIVHDLKNPLNAIINAPKNTSSEKQVKSIKQSGKQMLNMVLNILDIYKYEETKMVIDSSNHSLYKLSHNAVEEVSFLAQRKNIEIRNNVLEEIGVFADKEIIGRVFVNLLTNAIKFTPNNGSIIIDNELPGKNDKEQSNINSFVKIIVSDSGQGIPKDKLNTIFDKFEQVAAKKSGSVQSTGLGLTFCKIAVEAHGGEISVKSEANKGTSFMFTVPKGTKFKNIKRNDNLIQKKAELTLTDSDKAIIIPYITELKSCMVYELSLIKEILARINSVNNDRISDWKMQIEECINTMNEENYKKLIDIT